MQSKVMQVPQLFNDKTPEKSTASEKEQELTCTNISHNLLVKPMWLDNLVVLTTIMELWK